MSNEKTALIKHHTNAIGAHAAMDEMPIGTEMSVQAIVARKRKIGEVMEAVMTSGEHYGLIPGCGDKPSLFKSGAEVLATTFGLAPTFKITRTDLPNNHREYEIVCTLHHIATGAVVGEGVGTCSTMESKYRYRRGERKCPDCGKATIIKGRDDYGGGWVCFARKGGCGHKWPDGEKSIESQEAGRIENPDIADTYNTVLKIAKKRAQVDCTLTAVGASDILTQDLEDLPPPANHNEPERKPAPTKEEKKPPSARNSKAAANNGFGAAATVIPLNNDEADEIVEQLSKCESGKALQECANRTKDRFAVSDDDIRERLERVYVEQMAAIKKTAAEARARKAS
jgi:hypothetical protein